MPRPSPSAWLKRLMRPTQPHRRTWKAPRPKWPRLEELEDRWLPTAYVVNSTLDTISNSFVTLRDALTAISTQAASGDAPAGTPGANSISFNIAPAGVQTINVTGTALPEITANVAIQVTIDGTTQPGVSSGPGIVLNGSAAGGGAVGLDFGANSSGSTIRGLCIQQFSATGIQIEGTSGNLIAGNYIGTDITGTRDLGNTGDGVAILSGATANTVGGTTAGARNVISGNDGHGVEILGAGTSGNVVLGNYIGTDVHGTADLGNSNDGVVIAEGASANTVGGTSAGARNVLSGNGRRGITISDAGTTGNLVAGNYIGTNASGSDALGNSGGGIWIQNGASANRVGGTSAGARNVISGNDPDGVSFLGAGTSRNVLLGNYIGTNASGSAALGNAREGVFFGLGASANTVGGTSAGARNLISGNGLDGLGFIDAGTSGNVVLGNFIGTDVSGTRDLGNVGDGLFIGASANTVGGTSAGARNLISGNDQDGVEINGTGTSRNLVAGNYIGTNVGGTADLGNSVDGVVIDGGATANIVGGTARGAANVIAGNIDGVFITDPGTSGNRVQGNFIGTNLSGTADLGNDTDGVLLSNGASHNTIGGTIAGVANTIAFNRKGVVLIDNTTVGDSILGNQIFGNASLGIDLGDNGPTPNGPNPRSLPNSGQNFPVLTALSATTASGFLQSIPLTSYRLEFFASPASGSAFQGKSFLGFTMVSTNATGSASFTAPVAPIATGQLVTATATNLSTGDSSEFSPGQAVTTPPKVVGVLRYGFHAQPTVLLLEFDQPLDQATAQHTANYLIVGPAGGVITVVSASYDPARHTVTLRPARNLDLHYTYWLVVHTSGPLGVRGANGLPLEGSVAGLPGSPYEAPLTAANLVVAPGPWARAALRLSLRAKAGSMVTSPRS